MYKGTLEDVIKSMYQIEKKLDPVNPKANQKAFDNRKDKDIDNDGDVDSSDKYLHKRRKAISKAMKEMAEEIEGLDERRRDYSNLIPFPDKVLTDFAKRAKKAGLDFDQYTKFVKGTFKDGADEGRAIIKGREIFKDKEDGRKKFSGAQAKRDNIARRAALRKRLGIPEDVEVDLEEKMNFKTVVTKEDGGKTANTFSLLRDAKKYARKYSSPGYHVKITESGNKEVFILFDYIVEDWSKK